MRDDNKKTWHSQWASNREQVNRIKDRGGSRIDVRDQWLSERIKSYDKDAPEDALTSLRAIYEKRARIINHNCLDEFDTTHKPRAGKLKPHYQQPHESLDKIYIIERVCPESKAPKRPWSKLSIFKQCWSGAEQEQKQPAENYCYVMKRMNSVETHIPNGLYLYVIYSDMPQLVICSAYDSKRPLVGHTSLIKGRILWYHHDVSQPLPNDDDIDYTKYPVLLAGELCFTGGILTKWNNRSGHYRPRKSPVLEFGATDHILPRKLFQPTETG
ncbi:hypothetical protein ID850_02690 [Xenorhabdus sp. Flor]|uniref:hypothetical protein n=1 Tax=Xenorhabdus cabanillasii TaxID=351673 RepID=UPI0019845525|nr:hypothetical protein [Xenorhabdus sp. Flor]MBD2813694.1 hypothetical protein [Xenorhabdus sp. Flor]